MKNDESKSCHSIQKGKGMENSNLEKEGAESAQTGFCSALENDLLHVNPFPCF